MVTNISLEIIAFMGMIISLKILNTQTNPLLLVGGVGLIYLSNYLIVNLFENIFKVQKENNIIPILLKVLVPFYTLKVINNVMYKKNIYYILGIVLSTIIILFLEYIYRKKFYTRKLFNFGTFENTCISIFPFYFLKTGSIKIIYILLFLLIRKIYLKRSIYIKKEVKIIYILLILFSLILGISSIFNNIGFKGIATLESIFMWIFYMFIFVQFIYEEVDYKNILLATISSTMIFYTPFFIKWMNVSYKFNIRLETFIDITQTGVILGILNIIFVFYILYKKNLELIPYLLINFIFLILTGSKGPFILALLFSVFIFSMFIKVNKLFYVGIGLFLFISLYNSNLVIIKRMKSDGGSTGIRKLLYKESFRQFLDKPILGNGQGTYLEVASLNHKKILEEIDQKKMTREQSIMKLAYNTLWYTHSNPLELLRGSGIFSFIFYYSFISYIIFLFYKYYKKNLDKFCLIGLFSLLYFEIYGLIDNVIIYERLQLISFYIIFLSLNRVFKYDKL